MAERAIFFSQVCLGKIRHLLVNRLRGRVSISLGYQGMLAAFVLSALQINIKGSDSQLLVYLLRHISAQTLQFQEHLCILTE